MVLSERLTHLSCCRAVDIVSFLQCWDAVGGFVRALPVPWNSDLAKTSRRVLLSHTLSESQEGSMLPRHAHFYLKGLLQVRCACLLSLALTTLISSDYVPVVQRYVEPLAAAYWVICRKEMSPAYCLPYNLGQNVAGDVGFGFRLGLQLLSPLGTIHRRQILCILSPQSLPH